MSRGNSILIDGAIYSVAVVIGILVGSNIRSIVRGLLPAISDPTPIAQSTGEVFGWLRAFIYLFAVYVALRTAHQASIVIAARYTVGSISLAALPLGVVFAISFPSSGPDLQILPDAIGISLFVVQLGIGVLATLATLFLLQLGLRIAYRSLANEVVLIENLIVLMCQIGQTAPHDFSSDVKARMISTLETISHGFRSRLREEISGGNSLPEQVAQRLNGAANLAETTMSWVALPQVHTRRELQKALATLLAPLFTGLLHYLPESAKSDMVRGSPASYPTTYLRRIVRTVLTLLPGAILLTLGLTGWLIPADLKQWATGVGIIWLTLGIGASAGSNYGGLIAQVRDILNSPGSSRP